ncbi:RHS repeat-associated core domain-containing protein [Pseudoalteromonas luteoviolacea]|uniref:RHS repeat-associated core domain-containing protein n=1 Tax=Pseudoalteromonas luteoviolacea TaxID=43657 RepID=UPI001154CA5C|nr:RHS repeat-associated core domain-containing protein [Pseudoalteromonas luteoviolacea]TQF71264.1 hypothetical protein FLM44_09280 [Pseudoalteromonas luteoviolacea]
MKILIRLVHMNGRIFDADTGRFMQADPFVQAPTNLQNYNAYSYVLNNPLSYTDPSGYFFKKLAGTLLSRKGAQLAGYGLGGITGAWLGGRTYNRIMGSEGLQTTVAVALNFVPGCQVWCSALFSAQVNYYHTGSVGSALRAGATSAATAYAFSAIGDYYKGEYGSFAGAEFGEQLQWAGSHALVGGISSVASGGKFGHGFISAGFTKMVMGNAGFNMNNRDWDAIVGRTTVAAIVGGTASALTGGKFANGARTAAMMHALNAEVPSLLEKFSESQKVKLFELKNKIEVSHSEKDGLILTGKHDGVSMTFGEDTLSVTRGGAMFGKKLSDDITILAKEIGLLELSMRIDPANQSIVWQASAKVSVFGIWSRKVPISSVDIVQYLSNSKVGIIKKYHSGELTRDKLNKGLKDNGL